LEKFKLKGQNKLKTGNSKVTITRTKSLEPTGTEVPEEGPDPSCVLLAGTRKKIKNKVSLLLNQNLKRTFGS